MFKQRDINAKLKIGNRVQKIAWTGRSPWGRQKSELDHCPI